MRSTHYLLRGNVCFFCCLGQGDSMNLIIATSNTAFAQVLESKFKEQGVKVLDIATCIEDLLETVVEHKDIDGILLSTDLARKGNDPRLELLSDTVFAIKRDKGFDNVPITVLSDYPEGHPLLAELFEMGIYNFFLRNEGKFTVTKLLESFKSPMSFSLALRFRNADLSYPWRRDLSKYDSINVNINVKEQGRQETPRSGEEQDKKPGIKIPNIKMPTIKRERVEREVHDEWVFQDNSQRNTSETILGTVIIAVASVERNLGATNTALNIAKYLSEQNYDVAVVEGNTSSDFDRIHCLIHRENLKIDEMEFEFKGFDHFKYRENFDIAQVYKHYQYVVLDLGVLRDSPYEDEFYRSHMQVVTVSADEWKFHWIEQFKLDYDLDDRTKFVVANGNESSVKELSLRLKEEVFIIENTLSPYHVTKDNEETYSDLLGGFNEEYTPRQQNNKTLKIALASSVLTALAFVIYMTFK